MARLTALSTEPRRGDTKQRDRGALWVVDYATTTGQCRVMGFPTWAEANAWAKAHPRPVRTATMFRQSMRALAGEVA